MATTQLETVDGKVVAATVLKFIAEKEGWDFLHSFQEEEKETMSRDDWVMLGLTMACVIRGDTNSNAVWNAGILMRKLRGDE